MKLAYAKTELDFTVPPENLLGVLVPNDVEIGLTQEAEVERALNAPIGAPSIQDAVAGHTRVVIITSDITRPLHSDVLLRPLLKHLYAAGLTADNITIVFALGSHRPHTEQEMRYLVSDEVYDTIRCIDSDERDCVRLGTTSRGTIVDIFRPVAESDFVICLGNIEYHYFAGYSGGAKAIMPGVSTLEAIRSNHSMMVSPEAHAGNLMSPVRLDVEEAAALLGIDYIVNVVLDEHKRVIRAVAGDSILAHREGCLFLDSFYKINIPRTADIVIVSAGGYPKDQNMYQAQKALDNSKHAVCDGGVIIWLADCSEGLGSAPFEQWMTTMTPTERIAEIQRNFRLGWHKAAAVAMVQQRATIFLISSLDDDFVRSLGFCPFHSLPDAYRAACELCDSKADNADGADSAEHNAKQLFPSVWVMPYGGSTLPRLQ